MVKLINNYIGDRPVNEDKYFYKKINKNIEIFGLFDGHNGDNVSEFICSYFHLKMRKFFEDFSLDKYYVEKIRKVEDTVYDEKEVFDSELYDNGENKFYKMKKVPRKILIDEKYIILDKEKLNANIKKFLVYLHKKCFHKLVVNYQKYNSIKSGSTSLIGVYLYDDLYVANVGDTRLTLIDQNFKGIQITNDHNYKNKDEKMRILSNGGYFNRSYLFNRVNISRGFGDLWQLEKLSNNYFRKIPPLEEWHNYNITKFEDFEKFLHKINLELFIDYNPEIHLIENYKENIGIISASDGLWGVVNNDEISKLIYNLYLEHKNLNLNYTNKTKELLNHISLEHILKKWELKGKSIDNISYIFKLNDVLFI